MRTKQRKGARAARPQVRRFILGSNGFIWLSNGFYIEVDENYGECVSIHNLENLHKSIAIHIVSTHPKLSGKEFRFLRKEIGFSQKHLGGILGVEDQTIANWEKCKIDVPVMADRLIRIL